MIMKITIRLMTITMTIQIINLITPYATTDHEWSYLQVMP